MMINVWIEGYAATGESDLAHILGTYEVDSLDEAVKEYMKEGADNNGVEWDRFGRGCHAIWACEIFDNEKDARRTFG